MEAFRFVTGKKAFESGMGDVSVAIEEIPREEWGEKVYKAEIKDNPNIYHKPDYEYK